MGSRRVPGPATNSALPGALPVLGHLPWLRWRPLEFLERQRTSGAVTTFVLRRHSAYLVNEPDLVWRLLTELSGQVGRGTTGDKTRALTGNGLGSSDGEFHRQQRRLVQPVFHHERITSYVPLLRQAAEARTARWREGETVDLVQQMLVVATAGVLTSLFGTRSPEAMADDVSAALPICLDIASRNALAPVKLVTRLPTPNRRRYTAALARLHAVADALGEHRSEQSTQTHPDLLGLLRTAREQGLPGVDDQQVHDEIMTMLVAGVETTATTMSWALHLLSLNPDSDDRVRDELDRVLGGRPVGADDLPKLEHLQRVVSEALRLFPPVWLVRRRATASFDLGGHDVPVGASVYYSPYALHRDPRWYRDPERFDPDRWLPERGNSLPRGAYCPFGAGVHRCVGEAFGVAEVMTILATVIPHWRFSPASARPIRPKAVVTLRPERMPVVVRRRR
ncbi:cytochrome P450 [Umezawaea endophytica]|uniref:Cytochrome P450 n=1 Tax=Umezawaea endophytica TaxID=1654476 RepID=A0A9X2VUG3_9PSEU|nr:cytochrome P450 [Umezawaea endophytica]MCS7482861.1 cytochrome P450 [Umezawaea endophytica]